ncbi:excisionase family DNA-binding protein [Parapontixanthobacter aurantiacus]
MFPFYAQMFTNDDSRSYLYRFVHQEVQMSTLDAVELISPRQLARRTGWAEKRIRTLIDNRHLRYIRIGTRYLLPVNAVDEYIAREMVEPVSEVKARGEGDD